MPYAHLTVGNCGAERAWGMNSPPLKACEVQQEAVSDFQNTTLCINSPLSYTRTGSLTEYPLFEYKAHPIASNASVPEPTTMLLLGLGSDQVGWGQEEV